MRPRSGKSFESAITRIQARLTDAYCAEIVGRSQSLVRKWSNPAHRSLPNLAQAIALDAAFVAHGHGEPPILDVYRRQLDTLDARGTADHIDLREAMLSMTGLVGELSIAISEISRSAEPAADTIPPQSRMRVQKIIERLRERIDLIDDTFCAGERAERISKIT